MLLAGTLRVEWLVGRLGDSLTSELISNYTQGRVGRNSKWGL